MTTYIKPILLEPVLEEDGSRYAWTLVVSFDPDWQDFSIANINGGMEFRLFIPDEYAESLNIPVEECKEQS